MDRLIREGNPPSGQFASPVPQAWDPILGDFREITGQNLGGGRFGTDGVQWGKTASGLFVPIRVTNDGTQEVQLSGTIQPQWQERIPVFSAGKYTQNQRLMVERPTYAKGAIFVVKVSNTSGTFGTEEGWATRVRGYWGTAVAAMIDLIYLNSYYTSEYLRVGGWSATMIYPQALGDIELYNTTYQTILHREEMLLGSHVQFELDIKGTFEADEGITVSDGFAYWLS